jgi:hypothetical protein
MTEDRTQCIGAVLTSLNSTFNISSLLMNLTCVWHQGRCCWGSKNSKNFCDLLRHWWIHGPGFGFWRTNYYHRTPPVENATSTLKFQLCWLSRLSSSFEGPCRKKHCMFVFSKKP